MTFAIDFSSREAWADIAPSLHVADAAFWLGHDALDFPAQDLLYAETRLTHEGYLHLPPPEWGLPVSALAAAIRRLAALGIPPVCVFHYDEAWLMMARIRPLIATILGGDYAVLPEFWAWHIDPNAEEAGWPPHRDKGMRSLRTDGSPKSLTVWLPLTAATPLNGCMYVVPADRDPTYASLAEGQLRFALTDIRALPAEAGSILAWNQAIIHWGAHAARRDAEARVSLSCEFQRADEPPFAEPLLSPTAMPSFLIRQKLIARQLPRFRHMEPLDPAMEAWVATVLDGEL